MMRYYLILIDKHRRQNQAGSGWESGSYFHSTARYTISHADDETIDLSASINDLILAEQFVSPDTDHFHRVIVLESVGQRPFDDKTMAHLFTNYNPAWTVAGARKGFVTNQIGGPFQGVELVAGRAEGKATRRFLPGCLCRADLGYYDSRPEKKDHYLLRTDGPFGAFYFPIYRHLTQRIFGLDEEYILQPRGRPKHLHPRVTDYMIGVATYRAYQERMWYRSNQTELGIQRIIIGALDRIELMLREYEVAMNRFDRSWGDGHAPNVDFLFRRPSRTWFDLAVHMGMEFEDDLGLNGGVIPVPPVPHPSTRFKLKNPICVERCIAALFMLDQWYYQNVQVPLFYGWPDPRNYNATPQSQAALRQARIQQSTFIYDNLDQLVSYLFAVKNQLCILFATSEFETQKRPIYRQPRGVMNRGSMSGGRAQPWQRDVNFDYPRFSEVMMQNSGPFLTLEPEPVAIVPVYIPRVPPRPTTAINQSGRRGLQNFVWTLENIRNQANTDWSNFDRLFHDVDEWIYDRIMWMVGKTTTGNWLEKSVVYGVIFLVSLLKEGDAKAALKEAILQLYGDLRDELKERTGIVIPKYSEPEDNPNPDPDPLPLPEPDPNPPPISNPPQPDFDKGPRAFGGSGLTEDGDLYDPGGGGGADSFW